MDAILYYLSDLLMFPSSTLTIEANFYLYYSCYLQLTVRLSTANSVFRQSISTGPQSLYYQNTKPKAPTSTSTQTESPNINRSAPQETLHEDEFLGPEQCLQKKLVHSMK